MPRLRHTVEQILAKLREAEVALSKGQGVAQVCRSLGITEQTYYRWRNEYGGLKIDQAKRLKELEALALSFEGVHKCYAIQAGRELRVMVDADNVSDERASQLSFDISQKIETDMQYPGQIKVTVIREMRSVSYAK